MAHRRSRLFVVVTLLILLASCGGKPAPRAAEDRRIVNLHALARLYGVVRYFHPSDSAAAVDWNRFAVHGVRAVIGASGPGELETALRTLFAPIAPTVWIGRGAAPPDPAPPPSTDGLELVAWQHYGYGGDAGNVYLSKRHGRAVAQGAGGGGFVARMQRVDATPYRGKQVRLRGMIRSNADAVGGQLWLRVDLAGGGTGFFDNMQGRAVSGDAWAPGEVVGTVDAGAESVVFGVLLIGTGTAWFDDLELSVRDDAGTWTPIAIADGGLESADPLAAWPAGKFEQTGYEVTIDLAGAASGRGSLKLTQRTVMVETDPFVELPAAGEVVELDLGDGLRARVPLTLYSRDEQTLGDPPEHAAALTATVAAIELPTGRADPEVRVADVIVAWNVFQHFYPYFDVVPVDWLAALDGQLADALADTRALERLIATAADGHGGAYCPDDVGRATLPMRLAWIEDQVVVVASSDDRIRVGDVVTALGGRPAAERLAELEALESGSPQWRRVRALAQLPLVPEGDAMRVTIDRAGVAEELTLTRPGKSPPAEPQRPPLGELEGSGGVWYVDLDRASIDEIRAVLDKLATAPGVIFDLRGYPNGTHEVLSHLLTAPDTSTAWMQIPKILYPDRDRIVGWDKMGWEMPVAQPHIAGKVAFLTGPGAISYAESVMGLVEHYRLGEIVGEATAGTNGNVVVVPLPSGCTFSWTGMRVVKHDGARQHLIGIVPTVPATRTIAGVRAGRDEVLDRALEVVTAR